MRLTPIIIFVRRFESCLKFYQKAFDLKPVRVYRGKEHPRWAEFQAGDIRLALHGNYRGRPYREGSVAIHFDVKDIKRTIAKIKQYGGRVKGRLQKYDYRPAELLLAYSTSFTDPDGNEFEVLEVLKRFRK